MPLSGNASPGNGRTTPSHQPPNALILNPHPAAQTLKITPPPIWQPH